MQRSRPHCPGAKRPGVAQRDEPLDLSAVPATVSGMLITAGGTLSETRLISRPAIIGPTPTRTGQRAASGVDEFGDSPTVLLQLCVQGADVGH